MKDFVFKLAGVEIHSVVCATFFVDNDKRDICLLRHRSDDGQLTETTLELISLVDKTVELRALDVPVPPPHVQAAIQNDGSTPQEKAELAMDHLADSLMNSFFRGVPSMVRPGVLARALALAFKADNLEKEVRAGYYYVIESALVE